MQQKISKRTRIGPDGKIYQGQPDDLDEDELKLLEELNNLKSQINELKDDLEKTESDKQRYINSITEISEQFDLLSQEKDELYE